MKHFIVHSSYVSKGLVFWNFGLSLDPGYLLVLPWCNVHVFSTIMIANIECNSCCYFFCSLPCIKKWRRRQFSFRTVIAPAKNTSNLNVVDMQHPSYKRILDIIARESRDMQKKILLSRDWKLNIENHPPIVRYVYKNDDLTWCSTNKCA